MRRRLAALTLLLSGCVYPTSEVRSGSAPAMLAFPDADVGARVFVDGLDRGEVEAFDGKKGTLAVSPGRHLVELRRGETVVYRRDVFVAAGVRTDLR